jgi:hypothetical protein
MLLPSLGFGVTLHIPDSWDAWAYHGRRFLRRGADILVRQGSGPWHRITRERAA